jgi:hypothetical protein
LDYYPVNVTGYVIFYSLFYGGFVGKRIFDVSKICCNVAVATACVLGLAGGAAAVDYEAESWTISSAYPAAAAVTGQTGSSGNAFVVFNTAPTTAGYYFIELKTPSLSAGTYSLSYLYKGNSNRGIVQVSVDGVNIGTPGDQYTSGQVNQLNINVGTVTLGYAGQHQIRWTTNSKNASSSGYAIAIDRITLTSTGGSSYTLTTSGTNGTVTKSPDAASYPANTVVTLTATPSAGYVFSSWSGAITGNANPVSVTVNSNMSVVANFSASPTSYTLTTSTTGSGTVTRNPNNTTYTAGTTVTLTATAATGYRFVNWSADLSGNSNPAAIVMNANHAVTANFELIPAYQAGDMQYYDGASWTRIPRGLPGQVLAENGTQVPTWVNNGTWIDYSNLCTTEGWSDFTYKVVRYSVIGKTVHISYSFNGTSNSMTCSFSLPFRIADVRWNSDNLCLITNDGLLEVGRSHINGSMGNDRLSIWRMVGGGEWNPSGQKSVSGEITYEIE